MFDSLTRSRADRSLCSLDCLHEYSLCDADHRLKYSHSAMLSSFNSHVAAACLCFRIAVFSITVLHDERIVVVAEQRPDSTEEDSFQWMSRVLQVCTGFICTVYTHYAASQAVYKA